MDEKSDMGNAIGAAAHSDGKPGAELKPKIAFTDLREWIAEAKQLGEVRDVHRQSSHSRPGSRAVISWSSHSLPSGSLNAAYVW